ncbi:hypothetical protein K438DRAFT_887475 [Mycena galopus ATCC 62051]|nr:hypothetical protein K438DRAFT_887475 [Mycena galopus ATCC 62051]
MVSKFFEQPAVHCVDCCKTHSPRALPQSPFYSLLRRKECRMLRIQQPFANLFWPPAKKLRGGSVLSIAFFARSPSFVAVPKSIKASLPLSDASRPKSWQRQLTAIEAKTTRWSYPYDFDECATFFEKDYNVRPAIHRAPLIFGEVSRRWRAIALSTPRLWSSIFLDCRTEKFRANTCLCDMWLKRSGSLPLSIRFFLGIHQSPKKSLINARIF